MKIKKNDIFLILGFLGVAAALGVYLWVYTPTLEKTKALETEIEMNEAYMYQLEEWKAQEEVYLEETKQMIADVNDVFRNFPADSRAEDAIMYAVELEEQIPDTFISSISLSQPVVVYSAKPTTVKLNELDEELQRTYQLYSQQISYVQEFSYDGMKQFVDTIVTNPDRKAIEVLNMAYDNSTGMLMGTTTMNLYTIGGSDKEYQETVIPSMPTGTDNIFGTIVINDVQDEQTETEE